MTLYASSPDGLAQQQQNYDQLYGNANQNNAARYDAASARAVENILRQRASDEQSRQFDEAQAGSDSQQAWQSQENALNRASRERDVQTQYSSTHQDRQDLLDAKSFQQAQALADKGLLPDDEGEIRANYKNFTPDQIKVLSSANGQYKLNAFRSVLANSINAGNPILPDDVEKHFSKKSPMFEQAVALSKTSLAPIVQSYKDNSETADKGNFAAKILADKNAPPLETSLGANTSWTAGGYLNPINIGIRLGNAISPVVPKDSVMEPKGDWQSRAQQIVSTLTPTTDARGKQVGGVDGVVTDPISGSFTPAYKPAWVQAAAQPAQAVAPAVPKVDPRVLIGDAKLAIARGADPVAVRKRLAENYGIQF